MPRSFRRARGRTKLVVRIEEVADPLVDRSTLDQRRSGIVHEGRAASDRADDAHASRRQGQLWLFSTHQVTVLELEDPDGDGRVEFSDDLGSG